MAAMVAAHAATLGEFIHARLLAIIQRGIEGFRRLNRLFRRIRRLAQDDGEPLEPLRRGAGLAREIVAHLVAEVLQSRHENGRELVHLGILFGLEVKISPQEGARHALVAQRIALAYPGLLAHHAVGPLAAPAARAAIARAPFGDADADADGKDRRTGNQPSGERLRKGGAGLAHVACLPCFGCRVPW